MSESSDTNEGEAKAPSTAVALSDASKHVFSASALANKLVASVKWPIIVSTMSDVMVKAIKASTRTPHKQVLFSSGVAVGVLVFASVLALVAPTLPITFVFTLIGAVVTGLLATLLPVRGSFTTTEARGLERSWQLFEHAREAIEQTAQQMRQSGLGSEQIESELGPRRLRALDELLTALTELQGEQAAKTIESIAKTSEGRSPDEPKD